MGVYKNAFDAKDGTLKKNLVAKDMNTQGVSSNIRAISGTLSHKPVSTQETITESAREAKSVIERVIGERASVVITNDSAQNRAFYNPNEGVIYINNKADLSGEDVAKFVAMHEITHTTEGTKYYDELEEVLVDISKDASAPQALKDKIGDLKERQGEIGRKYEEQLKNQNVLQQIYTVETERNADLIGELLGNDYYINKLADRNLPLLKKLFLKIKGLIKKSADTDSASTKYLNKLASKFAKAIDHSQGGVKISQLGPNEDEEKKTGVRNERYDKYDFSKSFSEQIEDYKNGKFPSYDTFVVCKTPEVYEKIGLSALPMTINRTHIDYALNGTKNNDHYLGDTIKQLPQVLKKPIAIISSQTLPSKSVVVIVSLQHNNKQIIAPIYISGEGRINGLSIDSNAVTSVHARGNAITGLLQNALNEESKGKVGVFYLNKKETIKLMTSQGVIMPQGLSLADGFIHSIHEKGSPVNINVKKITETKQFKRWFGDWQKNSQNVSKVVNQDGTPKIVYHGSNQNFSVFDLQVTGKNFGETSEGFFFFTNKKSTYPNSATDYANEATKNGGAAKVYECYLCIKNPLVLDSKGYYDTVSYYDKNYKEIYRQYLEGDYDGVIIENSDKRADDGALYLVDDSTQVKLATDNVGTFDKENPDIRYSKASSEPEFVEAEDGVGVDFGNPLDEINEERHKKVKAENQKRYEYSEQARRESEESLLNSKEGKLEIETRYEGDIVTDEERLTMSEAQVKQRLEELTARDKFAGNKNKVLKMESVFAVTGEEFAKGELDLVTQVDEYFKTFNYRVYNKEVGKVLIDKRGIKDDIAHGIERKKAATFAAVPDVIKNGKVVDYQKNWKGRGYDTAAIAAPIIIANEKHYMGVVVIRNKENNRFYVHEVATIKEEGAQPFKTSLAENNSNAGGDTPSIISILQNLAKNSPSYEKNSIYTKKGAVRSLVLQAIDSLFNDGKSDDVAFILNDAKNDIVSFSK